MATVNPAVTSLGGDGSLKAVTWTGITNANADGAPIEWGQWADRCVQVTGTFGGATLTLQGSNDGTNWVTLNNAQGTAATFTAAGLRQIVELPRFVRPLLSGGSGSDLAVALFMRRQQPLRT
jgi:hypothetical protein